jgi:hypothetical protein
LQRCGKNREQTDGQRNDFNRAQFLKTCSKNPKQNFYVSVTVMPLKWICGVLGSPDAIPQSGVIYNIFLWFLSKLFRTLSYQLSVERLKKCFNEKMKSKIEKHSMHAKRMIPRFGHWKWHSKFQVPLFSIDPTIGPALDLLRARFVCRVAMEYFHYVVWNIINPA